MIDRDLMINKWGVFVEWEVNVLYLGKTVDVLPGLPFIPLGNNCQL